jgi:AcrR family transcriptional regulator
VAERPSGVPGPLVWDLPEPAGRRTRLDRAAIVRTAMAIADAEGEQAVTMRRVATELGSSTPMSLYRYVGGKGGIVDLMIDEVFAEIELPAGPGPDWRANLTLLARRSRVALRRHPWFAVLSHHRPLIGPHALRHNEWSLAAVDGHGLSAAMMMSVAAMVFGYALSFAQGEAEEARMRAGIGADTEERFQEAGRPLADRVVADGRYPLLARWIAESRTPGQAIGTDEQFELGLACLLDGIGARVITS